MDHRDKMINLFSLFMDIEQKQQQTFESLKKKTKNNVYRQLHTNSNQFPN